MELVATCLPGLADLLVEELAALDIVAQADGPAAARIEGGMAAGLSVVYRSRLAERVMAPVAVAEGQGEPAMVALAGNFDADSHLARASAINLSADHLPGVRGDNRASASTFYRALGQPLPLASEEALCLRIQVAEERSTLFVDLAGEPLGRRGYRLAGGQAPVRETLAAAMALLARRRCAEGVLLDPFCGSGTLLIEAALLDRGLPPQRLRNRFSFQQWALCRQGLWEQVVAEDTQRAPAAPSWQLKGFDADERAIRQARDNAVRAGVADAIHFERRELARFRPRDTGNGAALVLTNPPWGERLEEKAAAGWLHHALGRVLSERAPDVPLLLLGSDVEVMDRCRGEPLSQWRVRNGPLTNYLRLTVPQKRPLAVPLTVGEAAFELPEEAMALANRLRKNGRQLRKWLDREQVQAYRLYDRDLPEFNFSVDVYGDQVLMQEYKAPASIDEDKAEARRQWAVSAVRAMLGAHREQVHLRTRRQQKGRQQYQRLGKRRRMHVVAEGQGLFLVNLEAYLDSGLFLDHRPVRLRLAEEAAGKRFLNLFAYTGSATIHAALGGARSSVTVDASRTYLGWAAENLALNGLSPRQHRFERGDALAWLRDTHDQFDLIFCDPPTFSNNKNRDDFVVQRDHGALIEAAMARLEPGGVMYFSCNFSRFQLDQSIRERFEVDDLSRGSVPPDFARNQGVHHLFAIRGR